ncbi:MAG: helix-turn-helix transcriptional regulator [Nitrososphaeraceae archaeon]
MNDNYDSTYEKINSYSMFDETEEIFTSLANSQRLAILHVLSRKEMTLSSLAKELNVTVQEVHRNLNKLTNTNVIEKNSNNYFSLTVFGNMLIKNISSINFLSKNKKYFSEHDFHQIPLKFIHRIGSLEVSDFITGFVAIIEYIKRMYNNCDEYICSILPQVPLELIHTAIPLVKNKKIKLKHILPVDALIPKKSEEFLVNEGYDQLIKHGKIERRMINKSYIGLVLTEKQAAVMFPTIDGKTDMNFMFCNDISTDNGIFHEWCLDYFLDMWNNARTFDADKLKKV